MSKTAEKQAARDEAIDRLREMIKPGDTVSTVLRHVSRSGMSRSISVMHADEDGISDVSYLVARALDDKIDQVNGGVKVGGCGMDMGFHLVYNLSRTLYARYQCLGKGDNWSERCPSNTHVNPGPERDDYSYSAFHSDGYALHQRWV
jgi:hypothetical protein